jgi:hypothetical protein
LKIPNKRKKHVQVICFQSLKDPLVEGLMLAYLKQLSIRSQNFIFHLFTHEQQQFVLSKKEKTYVKQELRKRGIYWYTVRYHSGRFILIKKLYDFVVLFWKVFYTRLRYRTRQIIGFLPIAGGFAAIFSALLRMDLVVYCFEPHSEYMLDFGLWKSKSPQYLLLKRFERFQIKKARHVVVPTSHSESLIKSISSNCKIYVLPISVDVDTFQVNVGKGEIIRKQIGAENRMVLIYTGKFGGIYCEISEIAELVQGVKKGIPNLFFYVITNNPKDSVTMDFLAAGLKEDSFYVSNFVPLQELPDHLNAADIGLIAVPNFPSQRYRTPVKTGLYLACGLPYLVNEGVAEDDIIAVTHQVGVVFREFTKDEGQMVGAKVTTLLSYDRVALRERCRQLAEKTRSTHLAVDLLQEILENTVKYKPQRLLNAESH